MPKGRGKSKRKPATTSSDDSDSSSSDESSETSSNTSGSDSDQTKSRSQSRQISGNKSDSDEENDAKDQFLPEAFRPKPPKMIVSKWAKLKLRGPFLGAPLGKDERVALTDQYYCSEEDHRLFSAQNVADSPLAMLVKGKSNAGMDLKRIHGDLLFGIRVGMVPYEKILDWGAKFAKEKTTDAGLVYPAGEWSNVSYRYRNKFNVPVPFSLRKDVTDDEINDFLSKDFVVSIRDPTEKVRTIVQYAISYRTAFQMLSDMAEAAHDDARGLEDVVQKIQEDARSLLVDTGSAMRIFGNVCQLVKGVRENEYMKPLDEEFKQFLARKRAARTPKEKMEARAASLGEEDLVTQAKKYKKTKNAMMSVSKAKKERTRKFLAAKKAKADDEEAGPSKTKGNKDKKPKKRAGGPNGNKNKTKKSKASQEKDKDKAEKSADE